MRARVDHRGRSVTVVVVTDSRDATRDEVIDAACEAAGETRSSLYSHHVDRRAGTAIVELWRD